MSNVTKESAQETEEPRGELWFNRVFEAPRELVFRCLTEPEHLTHFWGRPACTRHSSA